MVVVGAATACGGLFAGATHVAPIDQVTAPRQNRLSLTRRLTLLALARHLVNIGIWLKAILATGIVMLSANTLFTTYARISIVAPVSVNMVANVLQYVLMVV